MTISEMSYFISCFLLLLPDELGSPQGPGAMAQPDSKESWRFLVLLLEWIQGADMQHSGWVTQVGKFLKGSSMLLKYETRQERERENAASPVGWVSIFFQQLLTRGWNIFSLGWEAGFHAFFPDLVGFPVMASVMLGLSGSIWLLVEWC